MGSRRSGRSWWRVAAVAAVPALFGMPSAQAADPARYTPPPVTLPASGIGSLATPCPTGQTPKPTSAPPPTKRPRSATADPNVTTLPDGSTIRQGCAPAPPVPFDGPEIAPANTVGGPLLARSGVVTDLPGTIPPPPAMPHVSFVLADADTGQVIAAKEAHALLRPASTLKTLTALVVLDRLPLTQVVIGADEDAAADGGKVGVLPTQPYTVDDLLNGLMLASGNDSAYALARAYGGRPTILADMNARAGRLGAWDTLAGDPAGLDADGQRTSAYDLALLGRAALRHPDLRRRAALQTATFPGGVTTIGRTVAPYQIPNRNPIISYPGAIGVKSGFTSKAANTLIAAATRDGRTLLLTLMGSPEPQAPSVKALLDWGFAAAGSARPVGRLVEPDTTPRPPEWGPAGSTAPVVTTAPEPSGLPPVPDPTESTAAPAVTATVRPLEHLAAERISQWWSSLPEWLRWLIGGAGVASAGVLAWWLLRRPRRRRGAYER